MSQLPCAQCVCVCAHTCNTESALGNCNVKFLLILEPQPGLVILGIPVPEQGVVWTLFTQHSPLPLARGRKGLSLERAETLPPPYLS